jgi:hypothetical protein
VDVTGYVNCTEPRTDLDYIIVAAPFMAVTTDMTAK